MFHLLEWKSKLKDAWSGNEIAVSPEKFKHQILSELKDLPEVLSVSRPAKRISWGIPVPGDEEQTIYVWLDALINYYTVLGYPNNEPLDKENNSSIFSNIVHVLGKDIIRFHSLLWPCFLLANKYPLPKEIVVHNFWLLGNVNRDNLKILIIIYRQKCQKAKEISFQLLICCNNSEMMRLDSIF